MKNILINIKTKICTPKCVLRWEFVSVYNVCFHYYTCVHQIGVDVTQLIDILLYQTSSDKPFVSNKLNYTITNTKLFSKVEMDTYNIMLDTMHDLVYV